MPEIRNNSAAPSEKNVEAKRTTIILEKNEREFIESLIKEGKEAGIKPLISKMLDIYKNMMIYDWHFPGEYYCGISRTAFVNVELLNILTQQIPKEKWPVVGEKMGNALKVSIQSTLGADASKQENWGAIFNRLKVQGFGDFYLKDKYLLLKLLLFMIVRFGRVCWKGCLVLSWRRAIQWRPWFLKLKRQNRASV